MASQNCRTVRSVGQDDLIILTSTHDVSGENHSRDVICIVN